MTINPLQLPTYAPLPQINFAPLDKIGDAIGDYRSRSALADNLPGILGQGGPSAQTASATPAAGAPPANFGNAIAGIESGGKYDAVGPQTKTGDVALGKYQVMASNVGPWSKEVLGRELTPQEFLASPQAQDAVFQGKFGSYVQKYGPSGAARAWFAGEGGMNNPDAKDQLGTTVAGYEQKFNTAAGIPGSATAFAGDPSQAPMPAAAMPAAPQQTASNTPPAPVPAGIPASAPSAPSTGLPQGASPVPPETLARLQAMIRAGGRSEQLAMALIQRYVVPPTPVKVGENEYLVNPVTNQVVAKGPPKLYSVTAGTSLVSPGQPGAAGPGATPGAVYENTAGKLDDKALTSMADTYLSGDHSVMENLGRGAMGSINATALQNRIQQRMEERNMSPQDRATITAEFAGKKAGEEALGTQEAKVGSAAFEAGNAIDLARGAIDKVSRVGSANIFNRPLNQLQQLYDEHKLNPDQTELFVRAQAVINTYSTVMSRNGVPTDSARAHAEHLLDTAGNPATWNRALDTLKTEIDMAKKSPGQMRDYYRQQNGGNAADAAPASGQRAALPQGTSAAMVVNDAKQAWSGATPQQRAAMSAKASRYGINLSLYGLQ